MNENKMNPRDRVLEALTKAGQKLEKSNDNYMEWSSGFAIEFEKNGLFKLLHTGDVIAPFDDMEELLSFIIEHS